MPGLLKKTLPNHPGKFRASFSIARGAARAYFIFIIFCVIRLTQIKINLLRLCELEAEHPQRCKMGDDDCLAHFCTYIVQHTDGKLNALLLQLIDLH